MAHRLLHDHFWNPQLLHVSGDGGGDAARAERNRLVGDSVGYCFSVSDGDSDISRRADAESSRRDAADCRQCDSVRAGEGKESRSECAGYEEKLLVFFCPSGNAALRPESVLRESSLLSEQRRTGRQCVSRLFLAGGNAVRMVDRSGGDPYALPPEIPSGRVEKDPVFCDLTQRCWADCELSFVLQCARFSGGSWGGVARVSAGGELLHHRIFPLQRDLSEGKDRNFSEERIHFRRRGNRHHLPVEEPGNLSGKRFGDYNGEFRFRL